MHFRIPLKELDCGRYVENKSTTNNNYWCCERPIFRLRAQLDTFKKTSACTKYNNNTGNHNKSPLLLIPHIFGIFDRVSKNNATENLTGCKRAKSWWWGPQLWFWKLLQRDQCYKVQQPLVLLSKRHFLFVYDSYTSIKNISGSQYGTWNL